jgi:L-threonylcarbamoyladenylate synthase
MAQTLRLQLDSSALDSPAASAVIERASAIWRAGGTVAFPTETVYGLGANALEPSAVESIFRAKARPSWDPLIVHVSDHAMLRRVAAEIPTSAYALIEAFWPGPLTLLLPKADAIPSAVTAGRPLVGVRMPAHPIARALIAGAQLPIAAPSANSFGRTSPTTAAHVLQDLDDRIDAIIDGGPTAFGLESTVIDPGPSPPIVYRPGAITLEQLRQVLGNAVLYQPPHQNAPPMPQALPSPGVGIRHYAPRAHLFLVEDSADPRGALCAAVRHLLDQGYRPGIMLPEGWTYPDCTGAPVFRWGEWNDVPALARRLFLGLRELDALGATHIVCPLPPHGGLGTAIRDRLSKAARPPQSSAT